MDPANVGAKGILGGLRREKGLLPSCLFYVPVSVAVTVALPPERQ